MCLQTFYHGEPVKVNVDITNSSNRNIKDISLSGLNPEHFYRSLGSTKNKQNLSLCVSVSVEQVTNVVLYSNDKYVKSVAKEETT